MSFRVNNNISAMNALRNVNSTGNEFSKSITRLSTGLRINNAADDPAGLIVSESFRSQVQSLGTAISNNQSAVNYAKTAEGALGESHSILQRMRELAIQSSNDTLTSNDRLEIQKEVVQLRDGVKDVVDYAFWRLLALVLAVLFAAIGYRLAARRISRTKGTATSG